MATHRLDASPQTVHWGFFDAKLQPHVTIDSGDTVTISSHSCMLGHLPKPGSGLAVPRLRLCVRSDNFRRSMAKWIVRRGTRWDDVADKMRKVFAIGPAGIDHPSITSTRARA